MFATVAFGQGGRGPQLVSLKQVPVPQPTNIAAYVKDQPALIALGKALFWDMQAGSDGTTACARLIGFFTLRNGGTHPVASKT